jgi:hypothetical protein
VHERAESSEFVTKRRMMKRAARSPAARGSRRHTTARGTHALARHECAAGRGPLVCYTEGHITIIWFAPR